ncbi:MAG: cytochrome c oxidase subunit 3, partial [Sulfuritalea sp.]|nr:cytochrome c oxidase subunit 3 [Sulfuritalea sp.]
MATHSNNQYYVPHGSIYPAIISIGLLSLASGFIFSVATDKNTDLAYLQAPGKWMMILGAILILSMVFKWMGAVITESVTGQFKGWEDKSFRIGMIVFICSEIAFFAAFFGALFYMRVLSVPELGGYDLDITPYKDFLGTWPSTGPGGMTVAGEFKPEVLHPMAAWGLPAINTA